MAQGLSAFSMRVIKNTVQTALLNTVLGHGKASCQPLKSVQQQQQTCHSAHHVFQQRGAGKACVGAGMNSTSGLEAGWGGRGGIAFPWQERLHSALSTSRPAPVPTAPRIPGRGGNFLAQPGESKACITKAKRTDLQHSARMQSKGQKPLAEGKAAWGPMDPCRRHARACCFPEAENAAGVGFFLIRFALGKRLRKGEKPFRNLDTVQTTTQPSPWGVPTHSLGSTAFAAFTKTPRAVPRCPGGFLRHSEATRGLPESRSLRGQRRARLPTQDSSSKQKQTPAGRSRRPGHSAAPPGPAAWQGTATAGPLDDAAKATLSAAGGRKARAPDQNEPWPSGASGQRAMEKGHSAAPEPQEEGPPAGHGPRLAFSSFSASPASWPSHQSYPSVCGCSPESP